MSRKPKKRLVGFVKMRETAELVMILFGFITMSYTYTCDLYKALMYNNHMNSNSLSSRVDVFSVCCPFRGSGDAGSPSAKWRLVRAGVMPALLC